MSNGHVRFGLTPAVQRGRDQSRTTADFTNVSSARIVTIAKPALVGRVTFANGPFLPLATGPYRRGAARQTCHSLQAQNQEGADLEFCRTFRPLPLLKGQLHCSHCCGCENSMGVRQTYAAHAKRSTDPENADIGADASRLAARMAADLAAVQDTVGLDREPAVFARS